MVQMTNHLVQGSPKMLEWGGIAWAELFFCSRNLITKAIGMNSVLITQRLKQALVDYLSTTFNANKDGKEPELAERIKESFEYPQALFAGPYLELILPYKKSKSILDLCKEGVLSKQLTELSCFHLDDPEPIPLNTPLYLHQERSIRKLCVETRALLSHQVQVVEN